MLWLLASLLFRGHQVDDRAVGRALVLSGEDPSSAPSCSRTFHLLRLVPTATVTRGLGLDLKG